MDEIYYQLAMWFGTPCESKVLKENVEGYDKMKERCEKTCQEEYTPNCWMRFAEVADEINRESIEANE